jgi:hypothetical protein
MRLDRARRRIPNRVDGQPGWRKVSLTPSQYRRRFAALREALPKNPQSLQ